MMKRSLFRFTLFAIAVLISLSAVGVRAQEKSIINLYSAGDTNITDWLQNIIIPAFEKQYPQYDVVFTNSRAAGDKPIIDRAIAALQTGDDPQVEVMDTDPRGWKDANAAGLWYEPTEQDIPNMKDVSEAAQLTPLAVSYRGSQVLLAYDSAVVAEEEVPTTYAELIEWIKANPGQFVYCRPDKGGSGNYMVVRALYEVSGKDPSMFKADNFDQAVVDEYYPKAMELLQSIHSSIYDGGAYPAGNKPVLELFADGAVKMATAWSDQAIEALNKGQIPETTKLIQFSDLPFPGSYTMLSIPKNAKNLKGAQDFVNFMLSVEGQTSVVQSIGGFPAVDWSMLPEELRVQFNSVITDNVPLWPGGDWGAPLVKAWYETVATNIDPNS
jgi:putative spermidine/putrescine transport system substrate-binding protein